MSYEAGLYYVVGKRGSGKTTTGKSVVAWLMAERRKAGAPTDLVVFDPAEGRPEDEWRPAGAVYVRGRHAFLEALRARAKVIVVKTPRFLDWSPLDKLRGRIVVGDEMHRFCSTRAIHKSLSVIANEGRHRSIDLVVMTPRPGHLHDDLFGNPTRAWVHEIHAPADRERIEKAFGVSLRGVKWKRIAGTRAATYPITFPADD